MPSAPSWKDVHADIRHRFRRSAGQDRALRGRGAGQRRDRRTPGHPTTGGVQVAQTLPRATLARTYRSAPGRTTPQFFPLTSSSRSKRWPANCPPQRAHRWPAGTARTWPEPPSNKASSRRSRAPQSGAGCAPMRSNPGSTGPGSSPATPTSPPRPHACSTCTHAGSTTPRCGPTGT